MDLFEQRITARIDKLEARMDAFEAKVELRLEKMEGGDRLLQLMATNTAMLIAVLVKLYFP